MTGTPAGGRPGRPRGLASLTIRSRPTSDSRGYSPAVFAELAITMSDATVWLSIGQALLFGGVCLLFGIWVARLVGLLPSDAPAGETLGVGLASGLMVLAAWWAALASGGRSSFTPVAVGFAIAVTLALVRRARPDVNPWCRPRRPRRRSPPTHQDLDRRAAGTSPWPSSRAPYPSSRWR